MWAFHEKAVAKIVRHPLKRLSRTHFKRQVRESVARLRDNVDVIGRYEVQIGTELNEEFIGTNSIQGNPDSDGWGIRYTILNQEPIGWLAGHVE
jgi:hypothetical protein